MRRCARLNETRAGDGARGRSGRAPLRRPIGLGRLRTAAGMSPSGVPARTRAVTYALSAPRVPLQSPLSTREYPVSTPSSIRTCTSSYGERSPASAPIGVQRACVRRAGGQPAIGAG
jgi:hypothetical protein